MAKLRLEITKGEEIRYISHLDYAGAIERSIRRANLPVLYSEGFNPHMKFAFASALAVGVTSAVEYMDVELANEELSAEVFQRQLSAHLPPGITIKRASYMPERTPALMAVINLATYEVIVPLVSANDFEQAEESIRLFNVADEIIYNKKSPKGSREINVKQYIFEDIAIALTQEAVKLAIVIYITPTGSIKPGEVLDVLVSHYDLPVEKSAALIHRTGLYVTDNKIQLSPLELR